MLRLLGFIFMVTSPANRRRGIARFENDGFAGDDPLVATSRALAVRRITRGL
jgi:hypothetical protein